MNSIVADLHIHSYFSDGVFAPEYLFQLAIKNNLNAFSITDHDTVKAYNFDNKYNDIEIINGVEFSCYHNNKHVHILGYFKSINNISVFFENIKAERLNRAYKIIDCLKQYDIVLNKKDFNEFVKHTQTPGRPHIARTMLENGYTDNIQHAFELYLGDDKPCYVNKEYISTKRIIDFIHDNKGIAILAHPVKSDLGSMILQFIDQKIDGIEIYTPGTSQENIDMLLSIAKNNCLIITGGSDFHGDNDYIPFGLNEENFDIFMNKWRIL